LREQVRGKPAQAAEEGTIVKESASTRAVASSRLTSTAALRSVGIVMRTTAPTSALPASGSRSSAAVPSTVLGAAYAFVLYLGYAYVYFYGFFQAPGGT
jgi:hypothetical protein